MTVLFEFGSDRHCGIKRDPGSLDQREGEQGSSDEGEGKVKLRSHLLVTCREDRVNFMQSLFIDPSKGHMSDDLCIR